MGEGKKPALSPFDDAQHQASGVDLGIVLNSPSQIPNFW
jgi:hypothetical protein